jgi:hypothetical protein
MGGDVSRKAGSQRAGYSGPQLDDLLPENEDTGRS